MPETVWILLAFFMIAMAAFAGHRVGVNAERQRAEKVIQDLSSRLEELRMSKAADEYTISMLKDRIDTLEHELRRLEL